MLLKQRPRKKERGQRECSENRGGGVNLGGRLHSTRPAVRPETLAATQNVIRIGYAAINYHHQLEQQTRLACASDKCI